MTPPPMHIDELVEHWTVLDEERELIAGKRGATRLGFAILLKFYTRHGGSREGVRNRPTRSWSMWPNRSRCPPRSSASTSGLVPRSSTTGGRSRRTRAFGSARLRTRTRSRCGWPRTPPTPSVGPSGFGRSCSSICAKSGLSRRRLGGSLGSWLRPCIARRSPGRIASRLSAETTRRIYALVGIAEAGTDDEDETAQDDAAETAAEDDDGGSSELLALIKSAPGNVSLSR